jgi:hypothetical protein
MEQEAEIIEMESFSSEAKRNFDDNRAEIKILEKLLVELYALAEPTRLKHEDGTAYTDEEMFEVNAANEFTVLLDREMQAEINATRRPSAAKIKNAMSNPVTWSALKQIGIIDPSTKYIASGVDPSAIQLLPVDFPKIAITAEDAALRPEPASNVPTLQRKPVTFD